MFNVHTITSNLVKNMTNSYNSINHWCIVRECKSTSIKTPEKLWIQVPNEIKKRNLWLMLAKRDPGSLSSSRLYICENHFDLENDMENYMQYKLMGSVKRIKMKPDCVPSRFPWQAEGKHDLSPTVDDLQNDPNENMNIIIATRNIKKVNKNRSLLKTKPDIEEVLIQVKEEYNDHPDPSALDHKVKIEPKDVKREIDDDGPSEKDIEEHEEIEEPYHNITSTSSYYRNHCCVVRECKNTSKITPEKKWIRVPSDKKRRNTWLTLAKRDPRSLRGNNRLFLCEDHFDLENDMENYMEYKIMGSVKKVIMKPDSVPSRFPWQVDRKQDPAVLEGYLEIEPLVVIKEEIDGPSEKLYIEEPLKNEYDELITIDENGLRPNIEVKQETD